MLPPWEESQCDSGVLYILFFFFFFRAFMLAAQAFYFWDESLFPWECLRQVYLIIWQRIIIIKLPIGECYWLAEPWTEIKVLLTVKKKKEQICKSSHQIVQLLVLFSILLKSGHHLLSAHSVHPLANALAKSWGLQLQKGLRTHAVFQTRIHARNNPTQIV